MKTSSFEWKHKKKKNGQPLFERKKVSFDDFFMITREQEEKGTTNSATNSHVPDNKPHPTSGQYPLIKDLGLNQFCKSGKQGKIAYCPNIYTVPSIAFRSSSSTSSGFIRDCKAHRILSSVSFLFCWFICNKYYWIFKQFEILVSYNGVAVSALMVTIAPRMKVFWKSC